MRTLLCIMHARAIPECLDSYRALDCDIAWMSGFTIAELGNVHREVIRTTDYDAYVVVSDDCIVTQPALDAVVALLADDHPAATGWCRLHTKSPQVNLCHSPLIGDVPKRKAYPFYGFEEVDEWEGEVVPTHFMGMSLTGMSRDMWRRYPYGCFTTIRTQGHSSDFHLCIRLRDEGVPMVAAQSGYIEHVKTRGRNGHPAPASHRVLVGEMPAETRIDTAKERA